MEFRVLGPVEVWDGSRPVDVGPRMPRAVLAMLLLDANRVVSQGRLIDGLWGDEPPPQATGTLQVYVSNLRRVLEPRQGRGQRPVVVVTRAPGYVLRVEPEALDTARFEAAVAEGRALLTAGDFGQAREVLRRALTWWRGAPYADVGLEALVEAEAARLVELRAGACEVLMEAELAVGGHAGVVGEIERLVGEEPLRERRWELFALALYRCGRQADALRAIAAIRATLREELGLEPGVTLRQLERDILRQAPTLDSPPPVDSGITERRAARNTFPPGVDPGWALVGRRAELAELERALDRPPGRRGAVVLVAGEPGVGKTRLATELVQRAGVRGVVAVWGRCYEGEGAPAFWPWTQVLRMLIGDRDAAALRSMVGPSAAELAHVVPELREAFPDGEGSAAEGYDPEKARFHLYETICRLVAELADRGALLVVLDDLHWADPASLQLLGFAAAQLGGRQVTVVGTYRDTEVHSSHPLGATLAALARHGATRVALGGLDRVEVGEFVTAATGVAPDSGLVTRLWDRTDGNPFFVGQLVRLLETQGGEAATLATEVPGGVRDVIRHRVGLLPEDTAQVLRLAAVVGRDFEMDVLARVVGGDEEDVLARVETALRAGLVIEQPETVGRCRFVHALVRETLYDELSALRRARLHRRVGEALEDRGGADPLELAHHFWQAQPAGAAGKALEHAMHAAEHASTHLAYEQAEEQLRRALDLIARLPDGAARSRQELELQTRLWVLLAPLHGYAHPEVGRVAARARELCWALGDHAHLVRPLWRLWAFHTVGARFQPAEECARELLEAPGRDADPVALLGAHHGLGMVAMHRGQLALARHHLEQAMRQPSGDDPLVTDVFGLQGPAFLNSCLAVILSQLGEEAAARHTCQLGKTCAEEVGHPYTSALTLVFEAWIGAVPLHPPRLAGHAGRFTAVLADCAPAVCLTTQDELGAATEAAVAVDVVAVEDLPPAAFAGAPVRRDDVAYLQYSSGSTRSPAGVVLTHGNVVDNASQALRAIGPRRPESTCVSWLPLFHDMGLVLAIAVPLAGGIRSVFMDPAAFIRRPVRWLLALTTNPGTITAAPDFAYALCASRVTNAERAWLDLTDVQVMINCAEPAAARTIDDFHRAFAECGLRPATHRVAYGLAEATALVSLTPAGAPPRRVTVDRKRSGAGVFVPCPGGDRAHPVVSCGVPAEQRLSIVDPRTGDPRPAGHVGEIWVCGPNVGSGYWGARHEHTTTFGNSVAGKSGRWLRTGDLGVRHEGELYVVGRLKDVITIDGRSHDPADIESTVEELLAVRPHRVAAISVPRPDGERVVVLAEQADEAGPRDPDEVRAAVRSAIATRHGIAAAEVVLVAPDSLPRTSSGTVTRSACRRDFLAGAFNPH